MTPITDTSTPSEVAQAVRLVAGLDVEAGPADEYLYAGVRGFVEAFNYWYSRVVQKSVPDYRGKIVSRVNVFVRRIELEGHSAAQASERLVSDWSNRNFVTAGGWAIEALATDSSPTAQKSAAEGIDLQREDPVNGAHHLYVLKSGPVTRNSDIVKALKTNAAKAERLLQQAGKGTSKQVVKNYAIASGKTTSTFEDGVRRPSSGELWSDLLGLQENDAVDLALAMAAVAGPLVRQDAGVHLTALQLLVASYISDEHGELDWDFLADRTLRDKAVWAAEDRRRHKRALSELRTIGYVLPN